MQPPFLPIYLHVLEKLNKTINELKTNQQSSIDPNIKLLLFNRLLDDVLWIFAVPNNYTKEQIDSIVKTFEKEYNNMHKNIKITCKHICEDKKCINFLDLNLIIDNYNKRIDFHTYFKENSRFQYLNYNSFHPDSMIEGFVVTELQRYLTHSSNSTFYLKTLSEFKTRLLKHDYP